MCIRMRMRICNFRRVSPKIRKAYCGVDWNKNKLISVEEVTWKQAIKKKKILCQCYFMAFDFMHSNIWSPLVHTGMIRSSLFATQSSIVAFHSIWLHARQKLVDTRKPWSCVVVALKTNQLGFCSTWTNYM